MSVSLLNGCHTIDLSVKGDERGLLVALEGGRDVPFVIQRVYYIFNTKEGVTRGRHGHKQLDQVLVCTSGACDIRVTDGQSERVVRLDRPN